VGTGDIMLKTMMLIVFMFHAVGAEFSFESNLLRWRVICALQRAGRLPHRSDWKGKEGNHFVGNFI
jgi:hypothetical protein